MKIGFLTPEYPHPKVRTSAGIGSSIKNLASALIENNVAVSIFVFGQEEDVVLFDNKIKIYLIKDKNYQFFKWFKYRKHIQNFINKIVDKENIDLIEAPEWTGITAFMNLKCPLILRLHGSDTYFCRLEGRPQKRKNYWFEKIALRGADHIISVSEFAAVKTVAFFNTQKPIIVIPNLINTRYFEPSHQEIQPGRLLYFGTLIRKKGVLEMAHIFNEIIKLNPEVHFYIAGADVVDIKSGRSTKEMMMETFSKEGTQKVKWLGKLSFSKILDELSLAQVVLFPSFAEALPMTWIEAMAMEKAMVTSNIGWAEEIMINGKTGYMENPLEHKLYAQKVVQLLNNPSLSTKMGIAARKQVLSKFSDQVVVKQNIDFYQKAIL